MLELLATSLAAEYLVRSLDTLLVESLVESLVVFLDLEMVS